MGKWTDKDYITHSEWSRDFGGASSHVNSQPSKKLPFHCCSLSLGSFSNPIFIVDETTPPHITSGVTLHIGNVFDKGNLIKYTKEHGLIDPITRTKFAFTHDITNPCKVIIDLHFTKTSQGQYCCPITRKVFNERSFIVALSTTGNVFSFEALDTLALQRHVYHDLIQDDILFDKHKHILLIQAPPSHSKYNTTQDIPPKLSNKASNVQVHGGMLKRVMKELSSKTDHIEAESKRLGLSSANPTLIYHNKPIKYPSETINSSSTRSEGIVAASLTSTIMTPKTIDRLITSPTDKRYSLPKNSNSQMAYVTMNTNIGNLNIELWTDIAPKTVYNFVQLSKKRYYDGVLFHRNIPGFMIQGGDPTGTGSDGHSIWKQDFEDEFNITGPSHNGRGLLSMANHGPNTNGSRFFITFAPCAHLDGKHTIFGKVVGGFSTLDKMEFNKDKEIRIVNIKIFVDPFDTSNK